MGDEKLRIGLVVRRHGLPEVRILFPIPLYNNPTIATLLELVNETVPLESNTTNDEFDDDGGDDSSSGGTAWGLEDYVVELHGPPGSDAPFEALHYALVKDVIRNDEEVIIRPLMTNDVRKRRLGGRVQISRGGKHLLDGVPFGRPKLKQISDRPAVDIAPRKRRKLLHDGDAAASQALTLFDAGQDQLQVVSNLAKELAAGIAGAKKGDAIDIESDSESDDNDFEPDEDDSDSSDSDSGSDSDDENDGVSKRVTVSANFLDTDDDDASFDGFDDDSALPEGDAIPVAVPASIPTTLPALPPLPPLAALPSLPALPPPPAVPLLGLGLAPINLVSQAQQLIRDFESIAVNNEVPSPVRDGCAASSASNQNLAALLESGADLDEATSESDTDSSEEDSSSDDEEGNDDDDDDDTSSEDPNSSDGDSDSDSDSDSGPEVQSSRPINGSKIEDTSSEDDSDSSSEDETTAVSVVNGADTRGTKRKHPGGSDSSTTADSDDSTNDDSSISSDESAAALSSSEDDDNSSSSSEEEDSSSDEESSDSDATSESTSSVIPIKIAQVTEPTVNPSVGEIKTSSTPAGVTHAAPGTGLTRTQRRNRRRMLEARAKRETAKTTSSSPAAAPVDIRDAVQLEERKRALLEQLAQDSGEHAAITEPATSKSATPAAAVQAPVPETATTASPRMRLDLGAGRRMLFGALGLKTPKTKENEEQIRAKLMENVRPLTNPRIGNDAAYETQKDPASSQVSTDPTTPSEEELSQDDSLDNWQDRITYRAVECCRENVVLSTPPFPFVQRWDPQQRGKRRDRDDDQYYDGGQHPAKTRERPSEQRSVVSDVGDEEMSTGSVKKLAAASQLTGKKPGPVTGSAPLESLSLNAARPGMVITWQACLLSRATGWQPKTCDMTGTIVEVEKEQAALEVLLQESDRNKDYNEKIYDAQGHRVYDGFEAPDEEEADAEVDTRLAQGYRNVLYAELNNPRIIVNVAGQEENEAAAVTTSAGPENDQARRASNTSAEKAASDGISVSSTTLDGDKDIMTLTQQVAVTQTTSGSVVPETVHAGSVIQDPQPDPQTIADSPVIRSGSIDRDSHNAAAFSQNNTTHIDGTRIESQTSTSAMGAIFAANAMAAADESQSQGRQPEHGTHRRVAPSQAKVRDWYQNTVTATAASPSPLLSNYGERQPTTHFDNSPIILSDLTGDSDPIVGFDDISNQDLTETFDDTAVMAIDDEDADEDDDADVTAQLSGPGNAFEVAGQDLDISPAKSAHSFMSSSSASSFPSLVFLCSQPIKKQAGTTILARGTSQGSSSIIPKVEMISSSNSGSGSGSGINKIGARKGTGNYVFGDEAIHESEFEASSQVGDVFDSLPTTPEHRLRRRRAGGSSSSGNKKRSQPARTTKKTDEGSMAIRFDLENDSVFGDNDDDEEDSFHTGIDTVSKEGGWVKKAVVK